MLFHLDKSLATCICHITIWHTPARLYLALNLSSSLSYDVSWDCFFSSFLLSSLCFSFCSAVWETPSNHQYNHHLFVQPSQSRRDNCLFQLGFLDPAVCLNNLSQICNAQFISLLIKCKCFSLASFDVNSCFICSQTPHNVKQSSRQRPNGHNTLFAFLSKFSQLINLDRAHFFLNAKQIRQLTFGSSGVSFLQVIRATKGLLQ